MKQLLILLCACLVAQSSSIKVYDSENATSSEPENIAEAQSDNSTTTDSFELTLSPISQESTELVNVTEEEEEEDLEVLPTMATTTTTTTTVASTTSTTHRIPPTLLNAKHSFSRPEKPGKSLKEIM